VSGWKLGRHWNLLLAVSSALVLVTVLLALFYAPVPSCSVKTANELASSMEGSRITISGFVVGLDVSDDVWLGVLYDYNLTVADFSDYARYLEAVRTGQLDGQWWTVSPVIVRVTAGGWFQANGPYLSVGAGSNVSATGVVVIMPDLTSVVLRCESGYDVVELSSPGAAGIMTAPIAQKIFYFHMPSAWVSYVGFFLTLLFGVMYLRTRDRKYDRIASSSAELGVLFATIAIATGPIWAKEEWGVYWRWDDTKLVTTFVMWLVYIGYLMLRAAVVDHSARARVSAVYGILGFVTMPMSLLSSRIAPLIQSSHPQVIASSSGSLSPEAGLTVIVAVVAFTFLFITMLIKRVEIEESEDELEELKRIVGGEE